MNMITRALALTAALLPLSAIAHQEGHGEDQKPLAATCADLAYPHRFEVDSAYPEIKALKVKCEAEKRAASKPAAKERKKS